jgi:hypothetical protein
MECTTSQQLLEESSSQEKGRVRDDTFLKYVLELAVARLPDADLDGAW